MLRHPRVKKLHNDRTWEDCVTVEELEKMAEQKWDVLDADKLDGHAKDVALLAAKYVRESQTTFSTYRTTQDTTQTTSRRSEASSNPTPSDAIVQKTQQSTLNTYTAASSSTHRSGSTQDAGTRASRQTRIFVRKDTAERLALATPLKPPAPVATLTSPELLAPTSTAPLLTSHRRSAVSLLPPSSTAPGLFTGRKRDLAQLVDFVSPPAVRRRIKGRMPLKDFGVNGARSLGAFDFDSQEGTIHIYAKEGLKVRVHADSERIERTAEKK
jgi:DNA ligase-4